MGRFPSWDPDVAGEITDAVREACPGVIINMASVQGLASIARVPLVGCRIAGSANALDKGLAKRLLSEADLPTARSVTLRRGEDAAFETLVEESQVLLRALTTGQEAAHLILAPARPQRRLGGTDQGLGIDRAFQQDDVSEPREDAGGGFRPAACLPRRQDDEREVGPSGLRVEPGE